MQHLSPVPSNHLRNSPRIEFLVDGHLFARQRIQGEAGRDLCNAPCALGDDHEINDRQQREDDDADDIIAPDYLFTEGRNNLACLTCTQDESGGGHVQAEPEQRGNEQQRGKRRELRRIAEEEHDHQRENCAPETQHDENIEQE